MTTSSSNTSNDQFDETMASTAKKKLCEPGICRIFFSSPFNGMEGEREELTKRYWPQITSLCQARGVQFVPVDMRWGITSEMSDDAQTINICLREIDRSDMFIGFFGQRYGWHGSDDAALQKNFAAALPSYPWLEEYRDRSVTELEFLHGHLRNPGGLPAYIGFRDKAWDDVHRAEGVAAGNKRTIYKYSSESERATGLMDDLKHRVKDTEAQCLAVNMSYPTPEQGAREMFECIMRYLSDELLVTSQLSVQSVREKRLEVHDMFCDTRCGLYLGGEAYCAQLNTYVSNAQDKPLLVTGPSGVGKTALVANWIRDSQENDPELIMLYHFVGASNKASDITTILVSLVANLSYKLSCLRGDHTDDTDDLRLGDLKVNELVIKWQGLLEEVATLGHRFTVVIDGLHGLRHDKKISKPYHWLSDRYPGNVHLVCVTKDTDRVSHEELVAARGWGTCTVGGLDLATRTQMCKEVLLTRGKALSPAQLERISTAEQTANPLYLRVTLEELCNFGRFRELDKKIDSMISSKTTKELFENILERCEKDYNVTGDGRNIVKEILSGLSVSRQGLSDPEIQELYSVPLHVWNPLYFTLEKFINYQGFMTLAYDELKEAVYDRYIQDETQRRRVIEQQLDFYNKKYDMMVSEDDRVHAHYCTEIPWLCWQVSDKLKLTTAVCRNAVFEHLLKNDSYTLLEYFQFLDFSNEDFIRIFTANIREKQALEYSKCQEYMLAPDITFTLNMIHNLVLLLSLARYHRLQEHFLKWKQEILESCSLEEDRRVEELMQVRYELACLYEELLEHEQSRQLFSQVCTHQEGIEPKTSKIHTFLGQNYHGLGTAYTGLGEYDKSIEYYEKSIASHAAAGDEAEQTLMISKTWEMMAHAEVGRGNLDQAAQLYEKVLKMQEDLYFGLLPPEVSYTLTNAGICYRKLQQFDKAKDVLERAMKIKLRALGVYHADVAKGYMNMANYYNNVKDYRQAISQIEEALQIYQHLDQLDTVPALQAAENLCLSAVNLGSVDVMRANDHHFWRVFTLLHSRGELDKALSPVHFEYLKLYMSDGAYDRVLALCEAYVGVPALAVPLVYCYIAYADQKLGRTDPRPYEQSLDCCLDKYPQVEFVAQTKLQLEVFPARDIDTAMSVLRAYYTASQSTEPRAVIVAADTAAQSWPEGRYLIQQRGLEILPHSVPLLSNLGLLANERGDVPQAVAYFEEVIEYSPDNCHIMDALIVLSLGLRDADRASKYLGVLEERFSDEESLSKKFPGYRESIKKIRDEEENH